MHQDSPTIWPESGVSPSQTLSELIELHFKISDIKSSLNHSECCFLRRIFQLFELELQVRMNALEPAETDESNNPHQTTGRLGEAENNQQIPICSSTNEPDIAKSWPNRMREKYLKKLQVELMNLTAPAKPQGDPRNLRAPTKPQVKLMTLLRQLSDD